MQDDGRTLYFLLDERVRELLFTKMKYPDRLAARLVCRQWNKQICSIFSFHVTIDDRSLECSRILRLPIYSCTIGNLTQTNWELEKLRFPTILNALIISGPITLTNFEGFLDGQHQLQNLQTLVIHTDKILDDYSTGKSGDELQRIRGISTTFGFGVSFPGLQSLELRSGPSLIHSNQTSNNSLPNRIFNLFLLSRFQDLREFALDWDCAIQPKNNEANCIVRLFKFIARHSRTLRSLQTVMNEYPRLDSKEWTGMPLSIGLKHIDRIPDGLLQDLQVQRFSLSPSATGIGVREWAAILYQQKQLNYLICKFHVCPFLFYKSVLVRNCHTLKELVLLNLSCWDTPGRPFEAINLVPFHLLTGLETLVLSRYVNDGLLQSHFPNFPDMTNTCCLPTSLTVLKLSGFRLLTDEIYTITLILTHLHCLDLQDSGISGRFGVTGRCLEHLLRSLEELEVIRIRGFNIDLQEDEIVLNEVVGTIENGLRCSLPEEVIPLGSYATHTLEWVFDSSSQNPFKRSGIEFL